MKARTVPRTAEASRPRPTACCLRIVPARRNPMSAMSPCSTRLRKVCGLPVSASPMSTLWPRGIEG
jgi:hypothetical protein